ncbi:glycosyltransferase family 39 protein [Spirillospora sp. NPDC047279]|uniref:ArnT family glycosyltransferase n=1 Tax=Spirillospora sp. NPDC047279 TaxID=3155478 RepID=UPI003403DB26
MAVVPVHPSEAPNQNGAADPPAPARPRRPLLRRRVVGLSALVAAATVLVQWVIMTPPLYFDPYYVWEAARRWPDVPLAQWPFVEVPHQVTRLGLVLPARAVQELLGEGQAAYFVITALAGCVFFVGCYLVVRSLFGDLAGLASVLVLLAHPFFTQSNPYGQEVTWSFGVMLPDMPGAGLYAIGMAALVVASRRTDRAQTHFLLAAGACFGSAFLVREFLAFLFFVIPVYLWLLRIPWRRNVTVAAPMVAILVANLVHNAIVWGDPMAGLMSAASHGGLSRDHVTRMLALNSFYRAMDDWHWMGVVFVLAAVLVVVGLVVTRDRRLALTLVWFLSLAVPLTLLAGVLDPQDISLRAWLPRYWFAVMPALLAGGFGSVILLARRFAPGLRARPRGRAAVAAVMAAVAAAYVVTAVREVPSLPRDKAWNELRVWLDGRDDLPVLAADRRLAQTLTFYTRSPWGERSWDGEIRDFPHDIAALPSAAYETPMLFTRWRGQEYQIAGGVRLAPDTGWRRLWRSSDGVLEIWDYTR